MNTDLFATRLAELRKQNDFSQDEIAARLGLSRSAVGMYEQGRRKPDFEQLDALAELFDVNLEYLLGSTDIRGRYPKHGDQAVRVSPDELEVLRAYQAASPEIRSAVRAVLGIR